MERSTLDYFDLFLLHDPLAGSQKRIESYRALLEFQDTGKLRSVGVSNFSAKHLGELKEAGMAMPGTCTVAWLVVRWKS